MNWFDEILYRFKTPSCWTPAGIVALSILIVLGVALLCEAFFMTGKLLR